MSFRKFGPNDIVLNTMRTHPSVRFFIYNGKVWYNNKPHLSGAFSENILNITSSASGGISLYEYNIDRSGYPSKDGSGDSTGLAPGGKNPYITPFISKDSARASFKTVGPVEYQNEFANHDKLYATYPLTASISREFMLQPDKRENTIYVPPDGDPTTTADIHLPYRQSGQGRAVHPRFFALKNRLNYYTYLSEHYSIESDLSGGWNKAKQKLNVISIPSIFYGSKILEGSLRLRFYVSGTLQGELRDIRENGELIQVTGSTLAQTNGSGSVAGVVLYNEGIIVLTGSWFLSPSQLPLQGGTPPGSGYKNPAWIYFGAGGNDGLTSTDSKWPSSSFEIDFKGQTEVQTYTMFAKADVGEVNYSNNPTFVEYNQKLLKYTGSYVYEENPMRLIKNTVSSSFAHHSASFKKQVYISRIAIYDKNRNLIGISTLSTPILKEEDKAINFKLKLDI